MTPRGRPRLIAAAALGLAIVTAGVVVALATTLGDTATEVERAQSAPLASADGRDRLVTGTTIAFIGDQGKTAGSRAVLELIREEGADAVVHSGDLDYDDDPEGWDALIDELLGDDFPYFVSVGNHDLVAWPGYLRAARERVDRIPEAVCDGSLGIDAACSWRGVLIVQSGIGLAEGASARSLEQRLADDASTWRICSWHLLREELQVGGKSSEIGWEPYETCREAGAIVATGHEHSYQRTRTLTDMARQAVDSSCPDDPDTPDVDVCVGPGASFAFVSGLGGQSVRGQERCFPTTFPYGCDNTWAKIFTADQDANHGALFITFGVEGDPAVAHGAFKTVDGRTIDDFVIRTRP